MSFTSRDRVCVNLAIIVILITVSLGISPAQPPAEIEQHIQHIQNAILPPVLIKGEPPATNKLADRMAALHVPGLSIAVIHDGKIEWARGFGVTRVGGSAVTPDTLFQAASISKPVTAMAVLHPVESRKLDLDPEELKGLRRRTSPTMEIVRSVKLPEIDPVFFETSYYVVPDRGGEKPYAILFRALQETQHMALARVGMYGREHVVIVRPGKHGMLAHTMFYVDEIRAESEFPTDLAGVGAKELGLAKTFLDALEAPFSPEEFKDEYREELQAMIATKAAQAGSAPVSQPPARGKPVVDILEARKTSIAMTRKPAVSETQPVRKAPESVAEIKSKRQSSKAR